MTQSNDPPDDQQAIARARRIIEICGGIAAVCRATGRSRTRVYSWTYPKERGGTGGMIPPQCQLSLMAHARDNDLPLTPEDFFPDPDESAAEEDAA